MKNKIEMSFPVLFGLFVLSILTAGCQTTGSSIKQVQFHASDSFEAEWIRDGQPLEFENSLWYPVDDVESFLDSEMRLMGEHRGVQYFVDKVDVRPYNRLYTKFDNNKFRYFEKKISQ